MAMNSFKDLVVDELRDLYSAEKQLAKALPKLAKAATHEKLKSAFENHAEETKGQIERLQQVFEEMDLSLRAKHCEAMEGLVAEAMELIEQKPSEPALLDCGLIAAAQKVEHYEIAGYGSAVAHAELLGLKKAAQLLNETLEEEKSTDKKLNDLATKIVNTSAAKAKSDEQGQSQSQSQSQSKGSEKSSGSSASNGKRSSNGGGEKDEDEGMSQSARGGSKQQKSQTSERSQHQ